MPLAFRCDADVAVAALGDVLTDGQAKTRTLDKVVEFDEALEDAGLLLFGDAGTCVQTIEQQSIGNTTTIVLLTAVPVVVVTVVMLSSSRGFFMRNCVEL